MVSISEDNLDHLTRRLVDALQPARIYLFGSQAYGKPGTDSDLDLLLVMPPAGDGPIALSRIARRVIGDIGCGVDVIVRTTEEFDRRSSWPSNFEATVKSKGRLLYG